MNGAILTSTVFSGANLICTESCFILPFQVDTPQIAYTLRQTCKTEKTGVLRFAQAYTDRPLGNQGLIVLLVYVYILSLSHFVLWVCKLYGCAHNCLFFISSAHRSAVGLNISYSFIYWPCLGTVSQRAALLHSSRVQS